MKTKTKKTKINWELLAKQAFNVGRCVARKANDGQGYYRSWNSQQNSSKKGYVAFAKFVAKAVKDFRG